MDLQDPVSSAQQGQGLQGGGGRAAQPLPQRVQTLLRHLPELLCAPVQLLQQPQTLPAGRVRGLWRWAGVKRSVGEPWPAAPLPRSLRDPSAMERQAGCCIPAVFGTGWELCRGGGSTLWRDEGTHACSLARSKQGQVCSIPYLWASARLKGGVPGSLLSPVILTGMDRP